MPFSAVPTALLIFCSFVILPLLSACGSAATDEIGRCKSVGNAKFVAARTDTDGKEWKFQLVPEKIDVRCNSSSEEGFVTISGVITDSLGAAKAGLVVRPELSGAGKALSIVQEVSDINTDACGVAIFTLKWTCPSANKEVAGSFLARSGALSSNAVEVTVSNLVVLDARSNSGGGSGTPNTPTTPTTPDSPSNAGGSTSLTTIPFTAPPQP